jgi:hypothetical protein
MTTITTPIYWQDQHFGLWVAPNPIPGQTMDTLLQIERLFQRPAGLPDMSYGDPEDDGRMAEKLLDVCDRLRRRGGSQ